jgi:hypothetical protein
MMRKIACGNLTRIPFGRKTICWQLRIALSVGSSHTFLALGSVLSGHCVGVVVFARGGVVLLVSRRRGEKRSKNATGDGPLRLVFLMWVFD